MKENIGGNRFKDDTELQTPVTHDTDWYQKEQKIAPPPPHSVMNALIVAGTTSKNSGLTDFKINKTSDVIKRPHWGTFA